MYCASVVESVDEGGEVDLVGKRTCILLAIAKITCKPHDFSNSGMPTGMKQYLYRTLTAADYGYAALSIGGCHSFSEGRQIVV